MRHSLLISATFMIGWYCLYYLQQGMQIYSCIEEMHDSAKEQISQQDLINPVKTLEFICHLCFKSCKMAAGLKSHLCSHSRRNSKGQERKCWCTGWQSSVKMEKSVYHYVVLKSPWSKPLLKITISIILENEDWH